MMVIDNKFSIGEIVYLVTDDEQKPRIVTYIKIKPGGSVSYELTNGAFCSEHYEFELSAEENIEMKVK